MRNRPASFFFYREVIMRRTKPVGCRTRIACCLPSYRPQLAFLEARLPPGDAVLGALIGSWLIAPRLLADSILLDSMADQFPDQEPITPLFTEPETQNPALVHFSFSNDPLPLCPLEKPTGQPKNQHFF
jgi:hypothetical protein